MTTAPDIFFATLIEDYLKHDDSITAGVPSEATLPRFLMHTGITPTRPSLVTAAREEKSVGARRIISVSTILKTILKTDHADAADIENKTTRAQASDWLRQIDDRLRNHTAFSAWLLTLTTDRRGGWRITKVVNEGITQPVREDKEFEISYATVTRFHFVIYPLPVA